jgi:hypothetical protein
MVCNIEKGNVSQRVARQGKGEWDSAYFEAFISGFVKNGTCCALPFEGSTSHLRAHYAFAR